jgi:L-fuculokinase
MEKLALVFDCGATNVRVVAINNYGEIKVARSFQNQTSPDPHYPGGRIWDLNEIWEKLCFAAEEVTSIIDKKSIVAVTTTTFGVDGTFLDTKGNLLYPVVSWQCERTIPVMQNISKYIPLEELYAINGINAYSFNTINKLIWFKENKPDVIDKTDCFLFMPSLINFLLTGAKCNDWSMLGTSMLTDIKTQALSADILGSIGIHSELFGAIGRAGQIIGNVKPESSLLTGIPEGTPVCLTGHDTQFAIFGSGAQVNQPVLSSGTWEILMVRSDHYAASAVQLKSGITTEFDAINGLYNIGLNWLGSGIIEWIKHKFYFDCSPDNCYDIMIDEAKQVPPGSNGVSIHPDFTGIKNPALKGMIGGLTVNTTRGEIIRAVFEALSFQAKIALHAIEQAGNFKTEKVMCVGGGSKNNFWNQLRADVLGRPIITIDQKETTVLGASFFAFTAAGLYKNPEQGQQQINYNINTIHPSEDVKQYSKLFHQWQQTINL